MKQHPSPTINALCRRCVRTCRQTASVVLVECRRFIPWPFELTRTSGDQLDLFPPDDSDSSRE